MTFSRSLLSRRRQVEILSNSKHFLCSRFPGGNATRDAANRLRRPQGDGYKKTLSCVVTFSAAHAELGLPASLDGRVPSDTPVAIPQKNSHGDCCKSRRRFASARANKALL